MTPWLIVLAVIIVAALAAYAGWLHYRLWKLRRPSRNDDAVPLYEPPSVAPDRRVDLDKSLYLLAEALLDDRMTHTEGCLRICALASRREDHHRFRRDYAILFTVAEATAHIPILDDWQALGVEERRHYDAHRRAVEAEHGEAVVEAAKRLKASFTRH